MSDALATAVKVHCCIQNDIRISGALVSTFSHLGMAIAT